MENTSLETETLLQTQLVGSINGLLGHGHSRSRKGSDLLRHLQRFIQQLGAWDNLADKTITLSLLCPNHVSGEYQLHGLGLADGADEALGSSAARDDTC